MSPRRRSLANRDLPDNLQYSPRKRDGVEVRYYYYVHPETKDRHPFGYDKAEAIAAAKQLNQLIGKGRSLVEKVQGGQKRTATLGEFVAHFLTVVIPARRIKGAKLSPFYVAESTRILNLFVRSIGDTRPVATISQAEIATYLQALPSAEAFNQHRSRLIMLWRHMVSDGLVPDNLPERIIKKDRPARVRQRLTLPHYIAIFNKATTPIQNAMEVSLNALQRRADIQKWCFTDQREGFSWVIQQKTKKHGPSAYLRIPASLPVAFSARNSRTLGEIIDVCRDGILCPYLIHHRPLRVKKSQQKKHPFQLSLEEISNGFAAARDASGLFDDVPPEERPTFHELLALGEHLRLKQGWSVQQIQALRGHSSERMTKVYLEGHEWTTVEIPASISR